MNVQNANTEHVDKTKKSAVAGLTQVQWAVSFASLSFNRLLGKRMTKHYVRNDR